MLYFIEFLRAVAVALITNSHFKGVYPNDILSFGGGLGLALFFMISGYLLANVNDKTRFGKWYAKKIVRLWVSLWIVRIIEIIVGYTDIASVQDFLKAFVFPGTWFSGAMAILYILFYIFVKFVYNKKGNSSIYFATSTLSILYLTLFFTKVPLGMFNMSELRIEKVFSIETPYLILQIIWFLCMLLGLYIRKNFKIEERGKKHNIKMFLLSGAFIGLFLAIKLLINKPEFKNLEFLLAVSYIGFAYSLFRCFMSCEKTCAKVMNTVFAKLVGVVSKCSLEVYYVQFFLISKLKNITFPINFVVLFIAIVVSAYVVHLLSDTIINIKRIKR